MTIHFKVWPYSFLTQIMGQSKNMTLGLASERRRSIFDSFLEPRDVVFVGDSLTEQAPWNDMFPNVSIANRGIGGETFEDMLLRLDDIVALEPKAVFLMGGVNDAISDDLPASVSHFTSIVETLGSHSIDVYIQATIEPNGPRRHFVRQLNAKIHQYAVEHLLTWIDTGFLSNDDGLKPEFTLDGLHLNGEGTRAWQRILEPHVAAAVE